MDGDNKKENGEFPDMWWFLSQCPPYGAGAQNWLLWIILVWKRAIISLKHLGNFIGSTVQYSRRYIAILLVKKFR